MEWECGEKCAGNDPNFHPEPFARKQVQREDAQRTCQHAHHFDGKHGLTEYQNGERCRKEGYIGLTRPTGIEPIGVIARQETYRLQPHRSFIARPGIGVVRKEEHTDHQPCDDDRRDQNKLNFVGFDPFQRDPR